MSLNTLNNLSSQGFLRTHYFYLRVLLIHHLWQFCSTARLHHLSNRILRFHDKILESPELISAYPEVLPCTGSKNCLPLPSVLPLLLQLCIVGAHDEWVQWARRVCMHLPSPSCWLPTLTLMLNLRQRGEPGLGFEKCESVVLGFGSEFEKLSVLNTSELQGLIPF